MTALVVLSALGGWLERRDPAWIRADPLLQPFGQGPPPPEPRTRERSSRERSPVPVELSAATSPELEALPGIGPATAAKILAWRDTVGVVESVDRLLEVHGIGPKKLEGLRPWIRLQSAPAAADTSTTEP
jgi:hypothetical protein